MHKWLMAVVLSLSVLAGAMGVKAVTTHSSPLARTNGSTVAIGGGLPIPQ